MSCRSLYEVVPLMSSGLLRSTSAGRPCRSFSAVARAFANTPSPCFVRNGPWSFGITPLESVMFSHPILRNTARSMRQMDEEMSSMLQLFNMGPQQRPAQHIASAASASPMGMTVEVKEDKKSLTFLASLPGFSRDDIKVKLTKDKVLVISGKHTADNDITDPGNSHSERISRTFTRRYQLPDDTETESISAKLQDGVLTLTVPKAGALEPQDQEIPVQEASLSSNGATITAAAATTDEPPMDAQVLGANLEDKMGAAPVKEDTAGAPVESQKAAREEQRLA